MLASVNVASKRAALIDRREIKSALVEYTSRRLQAARDPHRPTMRLVNLLYCPRAERLTYYILRENLTLYAAARVREAGIRGRSRGKFNIPKLHPFDRALYRRP